MRVNLHFLASLSLLVTCLSNKQDDEVYASDALFKAMVLQTTNAYRQVHNAGSLSWNRTLTDYAERWSRGCELRHSGGMYGENLALGYSNVTVAIAAWFEERHLYDFDNPQYSEITGHFTQLVWRATTSVGCGRSLCQDGDRSSRWLVVCEYYEAGNIEREFAENVHRALENPSRKTASALSEGTEHSIQKQDRAEVGVLTSILGDTYGRASFALNVDLWIIMEDH